MKGKRQQTNVLPHKAQYNRDYFPKNLYFIHNNRIHGCILRWETIVTVLLEKRLTVAESSMSATTSRHFCDTGLFHDNTISVIDAHIDHTIAADLQHKSFAVRKQFCRNREIVLHILISQNRRTGCHSTDKGTFTSSRRDRLRCRQRSRWLSVSSDPGEYIRSSQAVPDESGQKR